MREKDKGEETRDARGDKADEMEIIWKQVCYTRARFPKYCITVSALTLLILTSFLLLWNEGKYRKTTGNTVVRQKLVQYFFAAIIH